MSKFLRWIVASLYFCHANENWHLNAGPGLLLKISLIPVFDPPLLSTSLSSNSFVVLLLHKLHYSNEITKKKKKQKHVSETSVHRCAKSEGLRFDSSWGLRIFSLFHVRDKTRKKFPYASGVIQLRFLPKCSICYNELENANQSKGLKLTASESLIRTVIKIIQRRK